MGKECKKWLKHYNSAKSRCLNKNFSYYRYGVKFNLTKKDIEYLWFRDKAYLMEKPSIDRIDTFGNYNLINCRFIELRVNKKRPRRKSLLSNNLFKGVYYQKSHKKYRVVITHQGRLRHIGYFSNPEEAAFIYDKCIKEIFNEQPINRITEKIGV